MATTTKTTKELVNELDTRLLAARDAAKGLHAHLLARQRGDDSGSTENYLALRHIGDICAALGEIAGRL